MRCHTILFLLELASSGHQMATQNFISLHKKGDGKVWYIANHGVHHKEKGIFVLCSIAHHHLILCPLTQLIQAKDTTNLLF